MATVTGSKRHLDITSDTLTTSSNVDVGAKLFITTTDTNTTSTSALVLNSTEVETRTLGSLAFSSATYDNYVSWNLKTNDTQRTTVGSGGDLNIVAGTNAGVAYSAGGTVTISSTDTTYSAGTLLDLSTTTFNVDLTELTNNTATFAPTQDHFVILDNGVQGKKLASSIFGSAAYEASSTFATASHNHSGVYAPEYEYLPQASGAESGIHHWRKAHASYSNNSGNLTYLVVQTEVPQDNYSMGGFTLVYQDDYSSSGEGGEIKIYGYWNPESNGGFVGFRYECSNPYHTPTIEVCRNSSSGKTAFFISGEGGNYAQLIAKDLWLGYSASSATSQWGNGWVISEASAKDGYTNFDTLNRNDFSAITTNGTTPSLTGGVSATEVRNLIGAGTSSSDTTYTAGTGLTLTNTTFSVTANTYAAASHNHDDRYYTETESDARYPRGVTKTYSSVDTASDVDSWYKFFQITDSGNSPVVCYLRGYAHSSVAFIVSEGYLGGNAHIQILDYLTSTNNNYKWIKGVRIINNGDVEVLLNGGATVSLEMTIIGDAAYVSVPALSSAAAGNVVDSVTSLTNGMIRAKGTISGGNTGNWDTAYSWGNHASGGYMSSFILEDGDGTEVSISNGKEVKFVEGTGININWSDTSTGSDSDPYDLTFNIKNNSIGADQINVSGDGSSGQVLTSDGDGTMSWTNKTANTDTITSVGVANSEVSGTVTLSGAGATSLTQTGSTVEIRSTDTQYSDATTSTAGLMSTTDKTKLDGIESGADVTDSTNVATAGALMATGGTLSGTVKVTGSIIYENDADSGYIPFPKGGQYQTRTGSHTGAIKITLPTHGGDDMLKWVVDIYDYSTGESVTMFMGGYLYQATGGNEWVSCTVTTLTEHSSKDYTVRFGADGTNSCVWIGETNSTWSYPQVVVRDFVAGFISDIDAYDDDWSISFVTSFDTVDEVISDNLPTADWDRIEGKPSTFAPIIGTTATTALAGNTSLFDGAYSSLSGIPSTFAPSAHNHNGVYLSTSGGEISQSTNTQGTTGTTLLTLTNDVGSDISQQQTFIDFKFTDTNANFTPQVRIGAQAGRDADASAISKEGAGSFVVYTGDGTDESGGGTLTEAFRVSYNGNATVAGRINADNLVDATTSASGFMSSTDKTKLDGIASGAEVNVQSDWNAASGDAFIQNKPTLGTASASAATDFISATSADTAAELITFAKGTTTDGNSKFYNWRALDNTSNTSNSFWRIARITSSQSSRFMITLAGRSTSYSDNSLPAMGHIVGQLNNDNNYDVVFYNHSTASSEVVQEIGIVNVSNTVVDVYIKSGQYAELTATGHISDGSFAVYSNTGADGDTTVDGYITVTEYTAYNSGNLTPLTIGTTSTTAMAGNTSLFDGAYSSLSGKPTLGTAAATASTDYATAAHNHNDLYYTESEMQHFMARALGWVSGYGNSSTTYVNYNFTEDAIALSGVGDTSTGAVFKAIRVKAGDKVRFTVMLKGNTASSDGLYIRLYAYNGNLPDGKTHVSNSANSSEIVVVEDSSGDTGWEENRGVPNVWTNYERTYTAGNDGYVSLVVLNWTGHGNETIYIRQPDIQFEKVYDASNLGGTAASSYLTGIAANSVGITELNVTDGTSGQVLTTNGSGTLSFSTVASSSDTNYYLDGVTRTDSTNTLVFSVNGATNQSFTFGANAFNSTTIPAAEAYTAHEDTSTLSGVYGDTANGTKIDTITVDANGHITAIATGATGNMTGFFVEDGDGTEVQINNANEWKFVEGTGININWTDTSNGTDTDPYDLAFSIKDNSVSAAQLNVSGNGTAGQVLASDGDGTFSWVADANTDTVYVHPTSAGNKHIPTGGSAGQFLKYSSSGTATWATPSYTTNTDTQLSQSEVIAMLTAGTNVTISEEGVIASTDTDTVYTHPTSAGNKHIPTGGAAGQFLKYSSSGTATWATPSYTTNTNTTYSAGSGLDLSSTTFSVEADLRDGITHVGKDANNYIQFDSTNGRIDFYAGGVFVARMESDGDLHIKGDVIAFSDIFG